MVKYRTDLAVEVDQLLGKNKQNATGYMKKRCQIDEDISITTIEIFSEEGEKAFEKPKGTYVTIEVAYLSEQKPQIKQRISQALAGELKKMIPFNYTLKVLVVGLGNEKVTPDSLGPHTVEKIKITSHLFRLFQCDGDWQMSNVSGFAPSVTGVTGMETAELIGKAVSLMKPDVVIAIDALAAKDIHRISTTIQLCDTGISPGSGMGNERKEISSKTLGCKVISIGVPTVIDSKTLIIEAAEEMEEIENPDKKIHEWNKKLEKYLTSHDFDMIVTSTDIDQMIADFSDIISKAINIALHPGIYF